MPTDATEQGLHRVLGLWRVTASGVGIIIGAGIYVLLAPAADRAGGLMWAAFIVAALLSMMTGFSYMELASMFPRAGGEYEYARHVFRPIVSFIVGWAMVSSLIIASAAVSLGFGRYATTFFDIDERVPAAALLCLVAVVSIAGIQRASAVFATLSVVQVLSLVFIVAIGVGHVGDESLVSGGSFGGVFGAAALVFFAFIGFDEVITLSEETVNPTRTIPRALILALGISTALYVAVAIVAVSVLGADALAASRTPLADVATVAIGSDVARVVSVLAMATTMNTALLACTAATRMLYGMASRNALPSVLVRVNARRAPVLAVVVVVLSSGVLVSFGGVDAIAGAADFGVYVTFLSVNVVVLVLRRRRPDAARPFRVRGAIRGVPVVPVASVVVTLALVPLLEWRSILIGSAFLAAGAVSFAMRRRAVGATHGDSTRRR